LIDFVREQARIPVIETGAGVHTYVDKSARLDVAAAIITNAKARRVSVCNALDTLLVHRDVLPSLPVLLQELGQRYNVEVFADEEAHRALAGRYPAQLQHARDEHSQVPGLPHVGCRCRLMRRWTIFTGTAQHSEAVQ
jgi:glutamate-5-semialdehyde dehydrogenase